MSSLPSTSKATPSVDILGLVSETTKDEAEQRAKMEELYRTLQEIKEMKEKIEETNKNISETQDECNKAKEENVALAIELELSNQRLAEVKMEAAILVRKCELEKEKVFNTQKQVWDHSKIFAKEAGERLKAMEEKSQSSGKQVKPNSKKAELRKEILDMQGQIEALKTIKEFQESRIRNLVSYLKKDSE